MPYERVCALFFSLTGSQYADILTDNLILINMFTQQTTTA